MGQRPIQVDEKTDAKCGADFSLLRGFSPAFSPAPGRILSQQQGLN
jgi:hypothetical protein